MGGCVVGLIGLIALEGCGARGVFGIGYGLLSQALRGEIALKLALVLLVAKLAAAVVSYSSGAVGGIFAPVLFIGGMLGSMVGTLTAYVLHTDATRAAGAFALVGMGAVFAGAIRAPITSVLMIFEMTNTYSIILPLMIANAISYSLASRLSPTPVYEALLLQDGVHLPHRAPPHMLGRVTVASAMTRDVVTLPDRLSVKAAYERALHYGHHAYPVVDARNQLVGIITINDLRREVGKGNGGKLLGEVAGKRVIHAHPDQTLEHALLKLGRWEISQLPVVSRLDDRRIVGIITLGDIARACARRAEERGH